MARLNAVANLAVDDALPESWVDQVMTSTNYLTIAGANVASAATIAITAEFQQVTGAVTIDNINDATGAVAGQQVRLMFQAALTIRNNGGGAGNIRTIGGADRAVVANEIIPFVYDGALWREVGPQPISKVMYDSGTLVAAAATIDTGVFAPPAWASTLRVRMVGRSNNAVQQNATFQVNGDVGAVYQYRLDGGGASAAQAAGAGAVTSITLYQLLPPSGAPAGYVGAAEFICFNAFNTVMGKSFVGKMGLSTANTAGGPWDLGFTGFYPGTPAVTRLLFGCAAGSYDIGSRIIVTAEA